MLILVGCANKDDLLAKDRVINEQHTEIQALKAENQELTNRMELLEEQIKDLQYKDSYAFIVDLNNSFYENYPLLKEDSWDRIIISHYSDEYQVTIIDPLVIKEVADQLIGGYYEEVQVGSPPVSDVPQYRYTFLKGNQEQTIEVASSRLVYIDGKYYSKASVHMLGDAFYKPPKYIDTNKVSILNKLADSGYLQGTEQYSFGFFSKGRNIGSIYPLVDAKLLDKKPTDSYELFDKLIFYYYGEEIIVHVYTEKYVQVIDNKMEYWYELDDPTSVRRFLSAG